jgi:hypothetical protein
MPLAPRRNFPASVPSLHTSDKRPDARLLPFVSRPSPAYKTGTVVVSGYRANFCIRDIGTRLV